MRRHPRTKTKLPSLTGMLLLAAVLCLAAAEARADDQYGTPQPPRRLALVIGNSDYTSLDELKGSKRDAEEMQKLLESFGFSTVRYDNFTSRLDFLTNAFVPFTSSILEGDVVVFYFSGHGFSYGGESFLAPLTFQSPVKSNEVLQTFLSVTGLLGNITQKKPSLVVLILDACRSIENFIVPVDGDDPSSVKKGLSQVRAYVGNASIIYSSDLGSISIGSSDDKMSIFTEGIKKYAPKSSGKSFDTLKKEVRLYVRTETDNKQTPWFSESSSAEFYLSHSPEVIEEQQKLWESALAEGTRNAVEWYLGRYGTGVYANAARRWLRDHQDAAEVRTSRTPPSAFETAWVATGDSKKFSVTSGPVVFPAFETKATTVFAHLDDRTALDSWVAEAFTGDKALKSAIGLQVVVSQDVDARREPKTDSAIADSIAANTSVALEEVSRSEDDELWLKVRLPNNQSAYIHQGDSMDEVSIGKPLLQLTLAEREKGLQALLDEAPLSVALAELKANNQQVYWASIAIPTAEDDAEEGLFGLRAVSLRQTLAEAGIHRDRVTVLKEPTITKSEVRIRFFGE